MNFFQCVTSYYKGATESSLNVMAHRGARPWVIGPPSSPRAEHRPRLPHSAPARAPLRAVGVQRRPRCRLRTRRFSEQPTRAEGQPQGAEGPGSRDALEWAELCGHVVRGHSEQGSVRARGLCTGGRAGVSNPRRRGLPGEEKQAASGLKEGSVPPRKPVASGLRQRGKHATRLRSPGRPPGWAPRRRRPRWLESSARTGRAASPSRVAGPAFH